MKEQTTIREVAKKAGVSISTVSRALNGLDRVKSETRSRVMEAAKELNFIPNNIAVSMVTKSTKLIVVVVPEIINPFYTSVIQGVEDEIKKSGYHTLVFSTNNSAEQEAKMMDGVLAKLVDGIITIPTSRDLQFYRKFSGPVVVVDRYLPGFNLDSVVIDNYGGSYLLTEHIIRRGHSRIALISGPVDFNIGQERYTGYIQALKDYMTPVREDYIFLGDWYEEFGYRAMEEIFRKKQKPTAVVCANNLICMGAIQAFYDCGQTIGDEISLAGFDDNRLAHFIFPNVTVIDRPTVEMGRQAGKIILEKLERGRPEQPPVKTMLGVTLVERKSVRRISV